MIRSNGSKSLVGRTAIVSKDVVGFAYAGYLVRVKTLPDLVLPQYLHLACETEFVREQIEVPIRTTSGVKNINSSEISNLILPLPPFEEQKRIVTTVNRLMVLCDELEAGLRHTKEDGEQLLRAAVRSLLAPSLDNSTRVPALA